MHSYDSYGWLSLIEIPGRQTGVEPHAHAQSPVVGQPWPNFTGIEWVLVKYVEPVVPEYKPQTPRRLSKLGFVGRLGNDFQTILTAAKTNVQVELFVRMLDWATPDADGTSVDLDDPRVIDALNTLETAGLISAGRAAEILA